jgi:hypothetical protein
VPTPARETLPPAPSPDPTPPPARARPYPLPPLQILPPPLRERDPTPLPPSPDPTPPPCESETQGVLRTQELWYGDYIACSHLLDVCYIVNKQIKTDPVSWRGIDVRARMDPTGGVPPYRVLRGETHRMRRIYFDQGSGQRKI